MYAFDYHAPDDGCARRRQRSGEAADDGKLLAGGQTLLPTMKLRLAAPGTVIDLGGVAGPARHRAARAARSSSAR